MMAPVRRHFQPVVLGLAFALQPFLSRSSFRRVGASSAGRWGRHRSVAWTRCRARAAMLSRRGAAGSTGAADKDFGGIDDLSEGQPWHQRRLPIGYIGTCAAV